jgi:hypothetical protein
MWLMVPGGSLRNITLGSRVTGGILLVLRGENGFMPPVYAAAIPGPVRYV